MGRSALALVALGAVGVAAVAWLRAVPIERGGERTPSLAPPLALDAADSRGDGESRRESVAPPLPLPRYDIVAPDVSRQEAWERLRRGAAAHEAGDWWEAVSELSVARNALPDHPTPCVGLGIAYHQLNLTNDALALLPCIEDAARAGDRAAQWLVEQLARAADVEQDFAVSASDHFVASHPAGGEAGLAIGELLDALERARDSVESSLGLASRRLVSVVVYEGDQYERATTAPHWATASYDGKIRLSLEALDRMGAESEDVLTHEYSHALVHELVGGRLPPWFNEGLANNVTARRYDPRQLERMLRGARLFSVDELSSSFTALPVEDAERAYHQSYWMTRNLIEESGWGAVQDLLLFLADRPDAAFEDAFIDVYGETPDRYLDRWYLIGP